MTTIAVVLVDVTASTRALPEWVQWAGALGPAATLVAAVLAAVLALVTLRQRRRSDDKAEWWRRTQWALEQALGLEEERHAVGAAMLKLLSMSELAKPEDLDLHRAAWDALLQDVPDDASAYRVGERSGDGDSSEQHQAPA